MTSFSSFSDLGSGPTVELLPMASFGRVPKTNLWGLRDKPHNMVVTKNQIPQAIFQSLFKYFILDHTFYYLRNFISNHWLDWACLYCFWNVDCCVLGPNIPFFQVSDLNCFVSWTQFSEISTAIALWTAIVQLASSTSSCHTSRQHSYSRELFFFTHENFEIHKKIRTNKQFLVKKLNKKNRNLYLI